MLIGTPVVATHVGCVPELLGKANGLIAPPSNADALTHAVKRALTDRTLVANSLAVHGQERVMQHFTVARTQQHIEQLYQDLLLETMQLPFEDEVGWR